MIIPVEGIEADRDPENHKKDIPLPEEKSDTANREAEYLDQLQRLKAEFDNYRKRIEKEKEEYFSLAKGKVIRNLLPVMDDLERMVQYSKGKSDHLATGIGLVFQKMRSIFNCEGLEEIAPISKPFDPAFHEAIGIVQSGPDKNGLVVEECERGYLLDGRLLRPSKVRVGTGQPASDEKPAQEQ